jgi:hypothetical protein
MVLFSVLLRESMLRCRVSQQLRAQLLLIFCCLAAEHAAGRYSCPFDTCNPWQRIRELGADPDLLGYVWDGGSSHEYVQPDKNAGSGLSQPDGQLALTTLPHNRLAASASDSPSARFALSFGVFVGGVVAAAAAAAAAAGGGGGGIVVCAASGLANKLACWRMQHAAPSLHGWCGCGRGRRAWPGTRPTDAELLMHMVATFLDTRLRCPHALSYCSFRPTRGRTRQD